MVDGFWSLFTRQREQESRVHTELTQRSRERLASITHLSDEISKAAFRRLQDEVGFSEINEVSYDKDHVKFILNADTVLALSYVEHYMDASIDMVTRQRRPPVDEERVRDTLGKLKDTLVSEGILWEMKPAEKGVEFYPLESEAIEDMDKKVQALAEKEPWSEALKGYNAAFERYLDGDFDELIPKKLYNSIEEVLKTICVDLEGWTADRESSHAKYLKLLKDHDVYNANGITAPELGGLLDTLVKMISKVGEDRHQRHAYHDRAYCTLLIHQVGAYLYFIIGRYDDYSS